jgi:hypothetical protein
MGNLGAVFLVDDDAAAVVGLETNVVQTETGGVGTATDGDENNVCVELWIVSVVIGRETRRCWTHSLLLAALGSLDLDLDIGSAVITLDNLCVELELDALLGEGLLDVLCNLSIHTGTTDLAEELDNSDLSTETAPDRGHLETNDTTTNDDHLLGNGLEGNGASRGDDLLLVDGKTGEGSGFGTSCDDDVLAADAGLTTLGEVDLDGVLVGKGGGALDVLDVVLLEQELDTLGQTADRSLLGLHHLLEVELDIADFDTAVLCVVENLVVEMRVVEQRL